MKRPAKTAGGPLIANENTTSRASISDQQVFAGRQCRIDRRSRISGRLRNIELAREIDVPAALPLCQFVP
jgi:hypothetical protein